MSNVGDEVSAEILDNFARLHPGVMMSWQQWSDLREMIQREWDGLSSDDLLEKTPTPALPEAPTPCLELTTLPTEYILGEIRRRLSGSGPQATAVAGQLEAELAQYHRMPRLNRFGPVADFDTAKVWEESKSVSGWSDT